MGKNYGYHSKANSERSFFFTLLENKTTTMQLIGNINMTILCHIYHP